jgi:hypothetical protein
MLIIRVHVELADNVESAFMEWRAALSPIEWQDVTAIERMLTEADAAAVDPAQHVHFKVEQRFVVFLKDREIVFEELSAYGGEAGG